MVGSFPKGELPPNDSVGQIQKLPTGLDQVTMGIANPALMP
jgi:hypothetical protein